MRAFVPFLCLTCVGAAHAADLPPVPETLAAPPPAFARRVAPLVVYSYLPGVAVRAYWIAPWRHRHYFPVSGREPLAGRDEDRAPPRNAPEPAESFERHWSTSSAFLPERVPLPERPLK
jgi:hypothetical protein